MLWRALHPRVTEKTLGYLPGFLSEEDPRPAAEQLETNYPFGGWSPTPGFTMDEAGNLLYPGDPPTRPLAEAKLRGETIRLYEHDWVAIIQPDGSFECARLS